MGPTNIRYKQSFQNVLSAPKTLQVDVEFIKEAHASACEWWKRKLEQKFPTVFPQAIVNTYQGLIGRTYIPQDNSWAECFETGLSVHVMLEDEVSAIRHCETIIISEPYTETVYCQGLEPMTKRFVKVLYRNHTYRVLFDNRNVK